MFQQLNVCRVAKHSLMFQRKSDSYAKLLSVIPWIRYLFPEKCDYKILLKSNQGLYNFMKRFVDKQVDTYDENHQRHFLDMYIAEIRKSEKNNDFSGGFCCKYLFLYFVFNIGFLMTALNLRRLNQGLNLRFLLLRI